MVSGDTQFTVAAIAPQAQFVALWCDLSDILLTIGGQYALNHRRVAVKSVLL